VARARLAARGALSPRISPSPFFGGFVLHFFQRHFSDQKPVLGSLPSVQGRGRGVYGPRTSGCGAEFPSFSQSDQVARGNRGEALPTMGHFRTKKTKGPAIRGLSSLFGSFFKSHKIMVGGPQFAWGA